MSFVTRAPVRTPFALWLRGSRPTQADGPGRSIGPEDGRLRNRDALRTFRGPDPEPGSADPAAERVRAE